MPIDRDGAASRYNIASRRFLLVSVELLSDLPRRFCSRPDEADEFFLVEVAQLLEPNTAFTDFGLGQ